MKVVFINRGYRNNNYTFESLYGLLFNYLKKNILIEIFILKKYLFSIFLSFFRKSDKIYHITGDIHYISLLLPPKNTILTIHDVGHYTNTLKGIKKEIYKYFWFVFPINHVNQIHAISHFTKGELIRLFNVNPTKITVIYNPLNPLFLPHFKEPSKEFKILQIGSGSNKNLMNLILACEGLVVKLILINKISNYRILSILKEKSINYEIMNDLSTAEIIDVYKSIDVLYFASLYEGFGLPIIEAQAIGRPVITSNCASMPEIAGNGAILVDPNDIDEIRASIIKLMNDQKMYYDLVEKGFLNVKRFEISNIIEQYIDFYNNIYKK